MEWTETKKEYEVESGVAILKKFTSEPKRKGFEKKELLDLIFKAIGVFAIGLPIYMVSVQQKAGIRSQKAAQQSEIIINTAKEFKSIQNNPVDSPAFQKSANLLSNELSTKINLFFTEEVSDEFENINKTISLYGRVASNSETAEKLYQQENSLAGILGSFLESSDIEENKKNEKEQLGQLILIDSLFENLIDINKKLQSQSKQEKDTAIVSFLELSLSLNNKFLSTFGNIREDCNSIISDIKNSKSKNKKIILDKCAGLYQTLSILNNSYDSRKGNDLKDYENIKDEFSLRLFLKCQKLLEQLKKSNKLLNE